MAVYSAAIASASVRSVPMAAAELVGGLAGVLLFALPLKLGLIAACLAGLAAGLLAQMASAKLVAGNP